MEVLTKIKAIQSKHPLKSFQGYEILKKLLSVALNWDIFLIPKNQQPFFLQLHRKEIKPNVDLIELKKISQTFNEQLLKIFDVRCDKRLRQYYEISINSNNFIKIIHKRNKHIIDNIIPDIHRDIQPFNVIEKTLFLGLSKQTTIKILIIKVSKKISKKSSKSKNFWTKGNILKWDDLIEYNKAYTLKNLNISFKESKLLKKGN